MEIPIEYVIKFIKDLENFWITNEKMEIPIGAKISKGNNELFRATNQVIGRGEYMRDPVTIEHIMGNMNDLEKFWINNGSMDTWIDPKKLDCIRKCHEANINIMVCVCALAECCDIEDCIYCDRMINVGKIDPNIWSKKSIEIANVYTVSYGEAKIKAMIESLVFKNADGSSLVKRYMTPVTIAPVTILGIEIKPLKCWNGPKCQNINCKFVHEKVMCKFAERCCNTKCPYEHVAGESKPITMIQSRPKTKSTIPCKFGKGCRDPSKCLFKH